MTSKKTLLIVLILSCVVNFLLTLYFVDGKREYSAEEIFYISWIAIIEIFLSLFFWKRMTGELLSPYIVVVISVILFGMGQIFGWSLHINMEDLDLQKYEPVIHMHYIGDALLYTLNSVVLFIFGGAVAYKGRFKTRVSEIENEFDKEAIRIVSTILLFFSVPAFVIKYASILPAVLSGGYASLYTELDQYSKVEQFIPLLSSWLPIALIMKYAINYYSNRKISTISLTCIVIYVIFNLLLGGRSGPVMVVLAFIIAKQYLTEPFKIKQVLYTGMSCYLFMGLLTAIKTVRLFDNRTLGNRLISVLNAFSLSTAFGSFVAELGWSMSSLAWTMELLSGTSGFRKGYTYLASFTAIIPNLGFWKEHPAVYANLGHWLQTSLNRTTGLGYTFIAESYANFGWGGLIVIFILGYLCAKLMTEVNKENARLNYRKTTIIIMIICVLLKPFVRSSFSSIMRPLVFTVCLISFLISRISTYIRENDQRRI